MNNSKIALDNVAKTSEVDLTPIFEERKAELVKIIEAVNRVAETDDWKTLKAHIFDGVLQTLEKKLYSESTKNEVNTPDIYRLQGQLVWAKKYADLKSLSDFFKLELTGINNQLKNGKEKN